MDYITSWIMKFFVYISSWVKGFSKTRLIKYEEWEIGNKLKILLLGYNGARSTGADVRVAVIAKELDRLFGKENIEISVMTLDSANSKGYFEPHIRLIKLSYIYFMDILKACSSHHMIVLCEGATLKSKFSNALTLCFCQAAGTMKKQKKPCIAFGVEAGEMDEFIIKAVREMCDKTYFIARSKESLRRINVLGLEGHLGTDVAWTFESKPENKDRIKKDLLTSGWDGKKPLLGISVMNPYCWPIKPSIFKLIRSVITNKWDLHYKKWYYFSGSKEKEKLFDEYLKNIAFAINKYSEVMDFHTVIIGMDAHDVRAAKKLQTHLKKPGIFFSSKNYDGYEIKEILSSVILLITSSYHSRVLSLATKVPAIALSMDEDLKNIFNETGQVEKFYFEVGEENLGNKLYRAIRMIKVNEDLIFRELDKSIDYYYKKRDQMGLFLYEFTKNSFKGINLKRNMYGSKEPKEQKDSGKVS